MNAFSAFVFSAFSPYGGLIRPAMPQVSFNRAIGTPVHAAARDAAHTKGAYHGLPGVNRSDALLHGQEYIPRNEMPDSMGNAERTSASMIIAQPNAHKICSDERVNSIPSPPPPYRKSMTGTLNSTFPEFLANERKTQSPRYSEQGPFFFNPLHEDPVPIAIPRWGKDGRESVDDHPMLPCRTDRNTPNTVRTVDAGCRLHRILNIGSPKVAGESSPRYVAKQDQKSKSDSFVLSLFENKKNTKAIGLRRVDERDRSGLGEPRRALETFIDHGWWPASETWTGSSLKDLPHPGSFSQPGEAAIWYSEPY